MDTDVDIINTALERDHVHLMIRYRPSRQQYWQSYIEFRDLIMWYVAELGIGRTRPGNPCMRIFGYRIEVNEWYIMANGCKKIEITRSEFATLLADKLAKLSAVRILVHWLLPLPIAEEVARNMCAENISDFADYLTKQSKHNIPKLLQE